MWKEFRDFIARGNVIDLAVAVIIGGAFGAIVKSVVSDLLMPLIGIILKGVDFTSLAWTVGEAKLLYGNFIQAVINFLISAFVLFLIVRQMNKMKKAPPPAAAPEPTAEEKLLTEIRDLLKQGR
jgi:large conductance mechanosensitive channel